jgi:signal transduction histidine kinase
MIRAADGVGFNVNKKRKGIGISNMINRAEAFNREVIIESSPGEGTTILVTIPPANTGS